MVGFDIQRLAPLISAVERIRTSSVIAPLLALDVIVGVIALIATLMLPTNLLVWLWGLFGTCVLFTIVASIFCSFLGPHRLQTEQYQLDQRRLTLIGDERSPNSPKLIESTQSANTQVGTL